MPTKERIHCIQFVTCIKLLHVSATGCILREFSRTEEYKSSTLNWVLYRPHWND